jgi:hypothetical protein
MVPNDIFFSYFNDPMFLIQFSNSRNRVRYLRPLHTLDQFHPRSNKLSKKQLPLSRAAGAAFGERHRSLTLSLALSAAL